MAPSAGRQGRGESRKEEELDQGGEVYRCYLNRSRNWPGKDADKHQNEMGNVRGGRGHIFWEQGQAPTSEGGAHKKAAEKECSRGSGMGMFIPFQNCLGGSRIHGRGGKERVWEKLFQREVLPRAGGRIFYSHRENWGKFSSEPRKGPERAREKSNVSRNILRNCSARGAKEGSGMKYVPEPGTLRPSKSGGKDHRRKKGESLGRRKKSHPVPLQHPYEEKGRSLWGERERPAGEPKGGERGSIICEHSLLSDSGGKGGESKKEIQREEESRSNLLPCESSPAEASRKTTVGEKIKGVW